MKPSTNKKTIIFQSAESKALCDALIQAKSRETGISIMRLIENALIKGFGFENEKLTDWCLRYGKNDATTDYTGLLSLLSDNADVFRFYQLICRHTGIPLDNPRVTGHSVLNGMNGLHTDGSTNISTNKMVEHIFQSCGRKDLDRIFYDFTYGYSNILDGKPVPLENIVDFLLNMEKLSLERGAGNGNG